jgi:polysaccharide export outer membrane protein
MSSVRVDLISATRAGGGQYHLDDGGVVHVEKRTPEPVFVEGLVMKPNRYDYPPAEELRLLGAIALAGGASNTVADKVYVIRKKPDSNDTFVINLKISDAKRNEQANVLLAPGDVVSVEQTPGTVVMDVFKRLNLGIGATLPLTTFFGL